MVIAAKSICWKSVKRIHDVRHLMTLSRAQTFLALFASGALMPLALAPLSLWPIAILSTALLFWTLQNQTPKQALVKAAVFGFGLFLAGVSWVYISIHDHGFISAPVAFAGTILFCLFLALIFATPFAGADLCAVALALAIGASWTLTGLPAPLTDGRKNWGWPSSKQL